MTSKRFKSRRIHIKIKWENRARNTVLNDRVPMFLESLPDAEVVKICLLKGLT